jgi:hypothetical protein
VGNGNGSFALYIVLICIYDFPFGNNFITFAIETKGMKSSELIRLLKKDGWYEIRQTGSHVMMRHPTKAGHLPSLRMVLKK